YSTSNSSISVTAISGADNVKSVSFCRDGNNNTVVIIRPQDGVSTNFSYGKVNISNFYHSVSYNADLAVKSNYQIDSVLESSLTGVTTSGTITNAQFNRDSYLDFRQYGLGTEAVLNTGLLENINETGFYFFSINIGSAMRRFI